MTDFEPDGGPVKGPRLKVSTLMVVVGVLALLLTPLALAYRSILSERAATDALRREVEQSAYRANAERQRVQVELQKATLYAPRSGEGREAEAVELRDENERLRAEVARLEARVAELEGAGGSPP